MSIIYNVICDTEVTETTPEIAATAAAMTSITESTIQRQIRIAAAAAAAAAAATATAAIG